MVVASDDMARQDLCQIDGDFVLKESITMENTNGFKVSQYACAVLLIVSSIALVAYQVVEIDDVVTGLLYYVAQSFLLAGSIFGLDQYIRIIKKHYHENAGRSQSDLWLSSVAGARKVHRGAYHHHFGLPL